MFRRVVNTVKYGSLIVTSGLIGYTSFEIYKIRNPPFQLPKESDKKTLAILGSGWGAVSLLKDIDSTNYNIIVISPRNYFLFTPLLPSTTTGTVELRSVMQPIRELTRQKNRQIEFIEATCMKIDHEKKELHLKDESEVTGSCSTGVLNYDYLVVAAGAENATFNIPGVKDHACFLKESWDAKKIRTRLMDCIESAIFPGQPEDEVKRLLSMVVVGGGPTGVEYAAELHDFLKEDLLVYYPEIADKVTITLVEALPNVLPMFSKSLIEFTEKTLIGNNIDLLKNTQVKKVEPNHLVVMNKNKELKNIPFGLLVWATGNAPRPVISNLISSLPPDLQKQRRGLSVDENLRVLGAKDVFAIGDCTATRWAPTAQVASGQGRYLAKLFSNMYAANTKADQDAALAETGSFNYKHIGSLAYIGSNKAIADFPNGFVSSGLATNIFWKSAYLSELFSFRNRALVAFDWTKKAVFGRDSSRE